MTDPAVERAYASYVDAYRDETDVTDDYSDDDEHWGFVQDDGALLGIAAVHSYPRVGWMLRWLYVHPEHRRKGLATGFIAERFTLRTDISVTSDWRVCLPMSAAMRALMRRLPRLIWPTNIDVPDLYTDDAERRLSPVYGEAWWGLPVDERVPAFLEAWRAGKVNRESARSQWLHLWAGCIEDDSAALWRDVWVSIADGKVVTDVEELSDLPQTDLYGRLLIHRGEMSDAGERPVGMAWSMSRELASDYAVLYDSAEAPTVWSGYVSDKDVLAYIASRGEQEVIADPAKVRIVGKQKLPWAPLSEAAWNRAIREHQGHLDELSQRLRRSEP
jgi:GNAT superfamily N-acetyltransferase